MAEWTTRWRRVRPAVIVLLGLFILKLIFFAATRQGEAPYINDSPEGLLIEFYVDQTSVLFLEDCVNGRWNVAGPPVEIRVNGGDWGAAAAGEYQICNRSSLTPTLEVRLPSTAIASYKLDVNVIFGDSFHLAFLLLALGCALYICGIQHQSQRRQIALVAGVHGGLAIIYQLTTDLSIHQFARWGKSFHNLPMADLRHDYLETFLHLHSQPPLFSAFGIALNVIFGEGYADASFVIHVLLGMIMCSMAYVIMWQLLPNKIVALFASLALALHPALFLYEAFAHYTLLAAFLVLTAGFCLALYQRKAQHRYLACFALSLNLLILTRSVYHIAILIPILSLVYLLAQRNRKRIMVGCLLISLLAFGWYGKNLLLYGSFSTSTWLGMSLWRIARADYDADELVELYHDDVLNSRSIIWSITFLSPAEYGLDPAAASDIVMLSGNNANNLAYIDLNLRYLDNALKLMRHDLGRYIRGVLQAYGRYACPSGTWSNLRKNIDAMSASHHALSNQLIHMQGVAQQLERDLGQTGERARACSNLYFIIPLLAIALPLYALALCRFRLSRWRGLLRRESLLLYLWGAVAYSALATSLLEIGDNARFKFMSEFPLWILIVIVGFRLASWLQLAWQRARPRS